MIDVEKVKMTDIGHLTKEKRKEYYDNLLLYKFVSIPFCQLGEFLLYCYYKDIRPRLGGFSRISEVQMLLID